MLYSCTHMATVGIKALKIVGIAREAAKSHELRAIISNIDMDVL